VKKGTGQWIEDEDKERDGEDKRIREREDFER